ncbi:MAG TPA: hypothetical protein VHD83_02425 [Puia sp.]|nr:hypothetical protein [Puia sp.]
MLKKLLDLRFIIGLFFLLVGLLLAAYSFFAASNVKNAEMINRWCGIVFGLFGLFMILISGNLTRHRQEVQKNFPPDGI